ncbi:MAG TPA: NrfD/PsrC family molybdoenzyme membrane anchor subunit, partial [Acidobacteriota bacterium]|nr:NrfD/PsrC family molybdoenzyme membrane anchor subunit [Acidobacteriota bacterium]
ERKLLLSADIVFILLELLIIIPYIIHGELSTLSARESLKLILGGPYTLLFWLGVVFLGLLVPLAIEFLELIPRSKTNERRHIPGIVALLAGVLVLLGGFLLRYVFVYAGQISRFT